MLRYHGGKVYLKTATQERLLAEAGEIDMEDWPLAVVVAGDIDYDGQPDFWILSAPGASGSCGYTLLGWERKNSMGHSLFVPFPESQLPPSYGAYDSYVFFKGSISC